MSVEGEYLNVNIDICNRDNMYFLTTNQNRSV